MTKKYIPIGATFKGGRLYHHVVGVFQETGVRNLLTTDDGFSYPVVSTLELTIDEQTGKVISVEIVKE